MNNIVIGTTGVLTILLCALIGLTLYGDASRKNELENGLSQVTMGILKEYFVPELLRTSEQVYPDTDDVLAEVNERLQGWVSSDSEIAVTMPVCDFEKGIVSVHVEEQYYTPLGRLKTRVYQKTALVDRTM